jgi:hypothetical protein
VLFANRLLNELLQHEKNAPKVIGGTSTFSFSLIQAWIGKKGAALLAYNWLAVEWM